MCPREHNSQECMAFAGAAQIFEQYLDLLDELLDS
jgi:hypothetical protein